MTRTLFIMGWAIALAGTSFAQASYDSPNTGTRVLGNYFSTDVDNVDLSNGNLHINISLFTLPGRELPVHVGVDYNSQFVEKRQIVNEFGETVWIREFLGWRKDTGLNGPIGASRLYDGSYTTSYTAPNGVTYNAYKDYDVTIRGCPTFS